MSWIVNVPGIADKDVPILTKHDRIFDWVLGAWGGVEVDLVGEEEMRRCGVSEEIVQAVQNHKMTSDMFPRELIWCENPFTDSDYYIRFQEMSSGVGETFCREAMHIKNKAYEFKDGYLALGSFYPGSFEERAVPVPRSILDALHKTQDNLAVVDAVVCVPNAPIVETLATVHMPWLTRMVGNAYSQLVDNDDPVTMYLVIDSDYNAILLRQMRRVEIESLVSYDGFPFQEGEEYMIPMGAIAPSMGVTMFTNPGCVHGVPNWARFTPVTAVHIYKERRSEEKRHLEVPTRDGIFTLGSYVLYENPVSEGGTLRLPVAWGNTQRHTALTPRLDLNRRLVADMEWMTFFTQEDEDMEFITADQARDMGIVDLEVGFWSELDPDTKGWRHTAVDAHLHNGNSVVSYTLELHVERTREEEVQVYELGKEICRIDGKTRELNVGLARANDLAAAITRKVQVVFGTKFDKSFDDDFETSILSTIMEQLQRGYYPNRMYPFVYPDNLHCQWYGYMTMLQIRQHQLYMAKHSEFLVKVSQDSKMTTEMFKDAQGNLERLAGISRLAKWTRDGHRDQEAKRFAKRKKRECIPQARAFLEHWDDWLRKNVTTWPEKEAFLKNVWGQDVIDLIAKQHAAGGWTKVRSGMAFWEFARGQRTSYSEYCTAEEWLLFVEEVAMRDLQKVEEERQAAVREERKQTELQAKLQAQLKKKAAAEDARAEEAEVLRKAMHAAKLAEDSAKGKAEADAERAAISAKRAREQALLDTWDPDKYKDFEEYVAAKAREEAEEAAATEKARLDAVAAEKAAANEQRIKEARAAKEAEKAAHAAEREARRKKEAEAKAEAERASQAATVINRAKSGQAKKKESREAARQRDEGGGPPRRGRDAGAGASSGADAARAAIENLPRRGNKGGLGKGR